MKYASTKGLLVAACATLISACSTDDAADRTPLASGKVEVSLRAELPESRAQIAVDETNGRFSGSWEATDAMTVYANGETSQFTFDADAKVFKGQLTAATQDWTYQAVYPAVEAAPLAIPFGAARTQKGSNFNGAYDPLVSAPVTHAASEPGKTPAGDAVTFGLKRLTAILALTFTTDDATVKSEKVKSVTLTADGKTIAAQSFDITLADQTGALNADGQSSTVTLSYEAGSEPTAASFKAYFNVPAAAYGKLSIVVATEGHTAAFDLTSGVELAAGELAYKTRPVTGWTALAAAPKMEWVDHTPKADGTYEKEEIKEGMSVKVNLQAAAGIEGFVIKINSPILATVLGSDFPTEGNVVTMDVVNNTDAYDFLTSIDVALPNPLKGHSDAFSLDLSQLVPMILSLSELGDIAGDHSFTLSMADAQGRSIEKTLVFYVSTPEAKPTIVYNNDADLWKNTASLTVTDMPDGAKVQYRIKNGTWVDAAASGTAGKYAIAPNWGSAQTNDGGNSYFTVAAGTGVFAGHTYECRIQSGETTVATCEFTTASGDTIQSVADGGLSCYTTKNESAPFWGSGNNQFATKLCTFDGSLSAAYMQANKPIAIVNIAPGNLFTGLFKFNGALKQTGTVSFGQKYTYTARPTAIRFKYKATIGTVTATDQGSYIPKDEQDEASITVCIVDWADRHQTTAGKGAPTGVWNPVTKAGLSESEKMIAYGVYYPSQTVDEMVEHTIPLHYYDKDGAAPEGNYTIVISCATSRYGDYLNGCATNSLYIKDFEWVY